MSTSFFSSSNSIVQRPPTAAQRATELRHKVLKLKPISVPTDVTDRNWSKTKRFLTYHHETMRPSFILSQLVTELQAVQEDPIRRMAAHRRAFESVIESSEGSMRDLLTMIYDEYERSAGKGASDTYQLLLQRKDQSDKESRRLAEEKAKLLRKVDEMELSIQNLERKLRSRTEQLVELSAQHNIPLHFADTGMAFESRTRTMGEIRGFQEKLQMKVDGLDGKQALSNERRIAIEQQMVSDCLTAEQDLADISALEGVPQGAMALSDGGEPPQRESTPPPFEVSSMDSPFTTGETHNAAQHPQFGGGQVCADLEEDVDATIDVQM